MPKYRFAWDAFDDETVLALAGSAGYEPPRSASATPRAWLESQVPRPTDEFVRGAKTALERTWLPKYRGVTQLVDRLRDMEIGPMGSPTSPADCVTYIRKCRNSARLRELLIEALIRFGDQDRTPEMDDSLDSLHPPRFAILDPAKQPIDKRTPHLHQREAWEKLTLHDSEAASTGVFQGLCVMPTGAGKTYTAVRWLAEHVLPRRGRVLWLAHRYELLEQAASAFHALAGFVKNRDALRVRIVSGIHCTTTQIDPADDVLLCSVASLARRPDIIEERLNDPGTFLVVDEAHHSPAKSYRNIIEKVAAAKRRQILGLTATPTRTDERECGLLAKLFGGRVIYEARFHELVERGVLARPIPVRVETREDVAQGVTEDDRAHFERFNELSEEWLDRIAHIEARNRLIVNHFLEKRPKYGKTLIFAINVAHAVLLTERLREAGVRAEYVASYRADSEDNQAALDRFRGDDTEVLVNVQILTEGVDLPFVRTVFLARPTMSEILFRQMVGRALRGKEMGGGERAYLVSFEDHWGRFQEWMQSFDLVPEIVEPAVPEGRIATLQPLLDTVPWDLIRSVAAKMRDLTVDLKADAFECVPHGWYVLSRVDEGEDVRHCIAVYAHQHPCWEAMLDRLAAQKPAELDRCAVDALFEDFFTDCDRPAPSLHDISLALEHLRHGGDRPEYHTYADRETCDPYRLAETIRSKDLGERAKIDLLKQSYTTLARAVYPDMREFRAAVDDALHEMEYPGDATRVHHHVPVFEPRPQADLRPGPQHGLDRLWIKMLSGAEEILGSRPPHRCVLRWTRRRVKGVFGVAYLDPGGETGAGEIRINCLLDSPDIREATILYLLWHEYLHLYLKGEGHTKTFYELERKWKGIIEADRELLTLNERFGVQYR